MYFRAPGRPDARHLRLIDISTHVAAIASSPQLVLPIDFDHDGDLDLVIGAFWSPNLPLTTVKAYRNDGKGNFTEATQDVFGPTAIPRLGPFRGYAADVNHDGRADLIITDALRLLDLEAGRPESRHIWKFLSPINGDSRTLKKRATGAKRASWRTSGNTPWLGYLYQVPS